MEVYLPALEGNYDRPIDQPTDRHGGHKEDTPPTNTHIIQQLETMGAELEGVGISGGASVKMDGRKNNEKKMILTVVR